MKILRTILVSVFAVVMAAAARADWPLDVMNKHIDQTNWILDNQCSATTFDKTHRLLLTNWHCVSMAEKRDNGQNYADGSIFVTQRTYDNFSVVKEITYVAELVVANPIADLAVVRIRDEKAILTEESKLSISDDLIRGSKVLLVGNPQMQDGTLVVGYISSSARTLKIEGTSRKYFQVSGGVAGGASGGAVYNENGELIGVTAAASQSATYIGFAIPISVIREFLTRTRLIL